MFWFAIAVLVIVSVSAAFVVARRGAAESPMPAARPATESPSAMEAIEAFWDWWKTAAPELAQRVLSGSDLTAFVDALTPRVRAIDKRLVWETGRGLRGARHHLALSGEGDLELRALTERWLSRAPSPDDTWEYYAARQPKPESELRLVVLESAGISLEAESMRVSVDLVAERATLDVQLYSPEFARMEEPWRRSAAFLMIQNLIGEDAMERWLARIETVTSPPPGSEPFVALGQRVEELARASVEEKWCILQRKETAGPPAVYTWRLALKPHDHLRKGQLLTVTHRLRAPTELGMTTQAEADRLNEMEDSLRNVLGPDAVFIGRETGSGKRIWSLHVDATTTAEERTRQWVRTVPDYEVEVDSRPDPHWDILRRF